MGTEWDKEVVGKVDPQKRVLCLATYFEKFQPVKAEKSSPNLVIKNAMLMLLEFCQ